METRDEKQEGSEAPTPVRPVGAPTAVQQEKALDDLRSQAQMLEEDDRKASESLDKIVLVGGPAAILASLTFLKDIAPSPALRTIQLLIAAWVVLLSASSLGLISLMTTRIAARRYRRVVIRAIRSGDVFLQRADYSSVRPWNTATRLLSFGGIGLFLVGVMTLLLFAGQNLPRESHVAIPSTLQEDSSHVFPTTSLCLTRRCILVGYDYDIPPVSKPNAPTRDTARSR